MAIAHAPRLAGKGRQLRIVEAQMDAADELEAHRLEAIKFVDFCWPLLTRLELVARECGPVAFNTVMALEAALGSYERRHLPPEPEPPAVAA